MESSGGTGHAVQFAPRREETMWQHFLVVTEIQVNNRRFTVSATQNSCISDMRWKISEISLFRKNGVETPRYLLLKCFFGLHSPDMSLLS